MNQWTAATDTDCELTANELPLRDRASASAVTVTVTVVSILIGRVGSLRRWCLVDVASRDLLVVPCTFGFCVNMYVCMCVSEASRIVYSHTHTYIYGAGSLILQ